MQHVIMKSNNDTRHQKFGKKKKRFYLNLAGIKKFERESRKVVQFSLSKYFSLPEGSGMICGGRYNLINDFHSNTPSIFDHQFMPKKEKCLNFRNILLNWSKSGFLCCILFSKTIQDKESVQFPVILTVSLPGFHPAGHTVGENK